MSLFPFAIRSTAVLFAPALCWLTMVAWQCLQLPQQECAAGQRIRKILETSMWISHLKVSIWGRVGNPNRKNDWWIHVQKVCLCLQENWCLNIYIYTLEVQRLFFEWFFWKTIVLVRVYYQQILGNVFFMVFDFQGIYIYYTYYILCMYFVYVFMYIFLYSLFSWYLLKMTFFFFQRHFGYFRRVLKIPERNEEPQGVFAKGFR